MARFFVEASDRRSLCVSFCCICCSCRSRCCSRALKVLAAWRRVISPVSSSSHCVSATSRRVWASLTFARVGEGSPGKVPLRPWHGMRSWVVCRALSDVLVRELPPLVAASSSSLSASAWSAICFLSCAWKVSIAMSSLPRAGVKKSTRASTSVSGSTSFPSLSTEGKAGPVKKNQGSCLSVSSSSGDSASRMCVRRGELTPWPGRRSGSPAPP
mmetsp:Transcript_31803/g.80959  ORF Transcript_31803/g.80959 Transcript_31803/m.80959 type:complete len:214 (+) Transcript_31803:565-1206(+)